jgi:hypothetical protein
MSSRIEQHIGDLLSVRHGIIVRGCNGRQRDGLRCRPDRAQAPTRRVCI